MQGLIFSLLITTVLASCKSAGTCGSDWLKLLYGALAAIALCLCVCIPLYLIALCCRLHQEKSITSCFNDGIKSVKNAVCPSGYEDV